MSPPSEGERRAVPRGLLAAGQLALAAVWLYEGLVAKLLGGRPDEAAIMIGLPLPEHLIAVLPRVIGGYEVLMAIWILLGVAPRLAALAQTLTLIAFNVGGLVFGREHIADPAHLIVNNAALLALAWLVGAGLAKS